MRVVDAKALLPRDDRELETAFYEYDPTLDKHGLRQLSHWCHQFSPTVGLEPVETPQCLLFDVTGLGHLFGGENALAEQVQLQLEQQGYAPRVAVADSVGAAWAMSHFERWVDDSYKRREHLSIAAAAETEGAVSGLPIQSLRLAANTLDLLSQLGITRVEQLEQLPRRALVARFGQQVIERLDQVYAKRHEVIIAEETPCSMEAQWALEHPTAHRQTLDQIIERLVLQVSRLLLSEQEGALQMTCRLHCSGHAPVTIRVGLYRPTAHPQHLLELIRMQMDLAAVPGTVDNIHIMVTSSGPLSQRQRGLFEAGQGANPQQLAILIDQLSSRLGQHQVVRVRLQPTAHPEYAYQYVPLAGTGSLTANREIPKRNKQAMRSLHFPKQGHRPLKFYQPPRPLEVQVVSPTRNDATSNSRRDSYSVPHSPAVIHWQGRRLAVSCYWGPERIETKWWQGQSIRRDYYRVETETGQRFWIFQRLQDKSWFLQGEFE
jgi:protein ImuB